MFQRLKDLREDNDLKQEYVATQILKINRVQYVRYENGQNEIPVKHLITLAKYYNVSLDYLTGLINTPKELTKEQADIYQPQKDPNLLFASEIKKIYKKYFGG